MEPEEKDTELSSEQEYESPFYGGDDEGEVLTDDLAALYKEMERGEIASEDDTIAEDDTTATDETDTEDVDAEELAEDETNPDEDEEATEDEDISAVDEANADDDDSEDAAQEDTTEEEPSPASTRSMVPKTRLDAKNRIIEDLNKKVLELQGERPATNNNAGLDVTLEDADLDPAEMFDAIIDGKIDEASGMFNKIMRGVATQTAQQMANVVDAKVEDGTSQASQQRLFDTAVDTAFGQHPFLDPDSDVFDLKTSRAVTAYQQTLVSSGEATPEEAVAQAVTDLIPLLRPETLENAPDPVKQVKEKANQGKKTAKKVKELSDTQPADTKTSAAEGDEGINIDTMTLEELDSLPESTIARLRGDFL